MLKQRFMRWWPLFLISSLGLFLEMTVVRWIAAEVRLFSYFKNLPMLAAFLGLSIGFALVGKGRDYCRVLAPLLGLFVVLVLVAGRVISPRALAYPGGSDEFLWATADFSYWLSLALFLGVVLVFFVLTVLLFIPLGQATGNEMARHAPIPAYIVNLLASLVGIWLFALFSYLRTPPAIWFGLAVLGAAVYLAALRTLSRLSLVFLILIPLVLLAFGGGTIWSPYHRVDIVDLYLPRERDGSMVKVGYTLKIQQVFYLVALDLSQGFLTQLDGEIPLMEDAALTYNTPYRLGPTGGRVLVVGSGMGNDVAAALRGGASHVDAVEIDPVIAALGQRLHPEQPYSDPRVTLVVDDARSFLNRNSDRYDVIVFGFLDSHTLLSGLSSVRLDSFVYTIESFEQVRDHLAEDGIVTVSFAVGAPWIEQRLGQMLIEVFGPDKVFAQRAGLGLTFVVGSISPALMAENQVVAWRPDAAAGEVPLATDDWPYLYMRARRIPAAYWQVLLAAGLICCAMIARSFPEALRPNWHFWLLGAAFLLIEFKSITEFALLFGTTWLVNVLAVSGVLLMALGANIVVLKRRYVNLWLAYGLLFVSLVLTYAFPMDLLLGFSPVVRGLGSIIILSLPLFFAGLIFSESLRRAGETARPLASNLSGSVVGGVLEYGSLIWGIKGLYVIAAIVYVGALVALRVQRK